MSDSNLIGSKNPRLKRLRRLVRQRKARSQERAFVVEGMVLVTEALASGLEVEEIFVQGEIPAELADIASLGTVIIRPVFPGTLEAVLDTVSPQPVVAVVEMPHAGLDDLVSDKPVLVLDNVRDPGNAGTLIRTAEAAGCGAVVLTGESVDPSNPKVVRSAAGALFRLPVISKPDAIELFDTFGEQGRVVAATVLSAPPGRTLVPYDELDLSTAAIVLGNEAHGLSDELVSAASTLITIPLAGPTESLNVAAAGAVLCFASWQQRRHQADPARN